MWFSMVEPKGHPCPILVGNVSAKRYTIVSERNSPHSSSYLISLKYLKLEVDHSP